MSEEGKKTTVITIRVTEEMKEQLQAVARAEHRPMSSQIIHILQPYLAGHTPQGHEG